MSRKAFTSIADHIIRLKMIPYFDIASSILCGLSMREDLGPTAHKFSHKNPLACWISFMIFLFAGNMFCNLLLGEPILAPLKNNRQILLATLIWYFIFYMPFDIGYKVVKLLPIKMICVVMKEMYRCKQIHDGVAHAAKIYPKAYLIMVIIGTLKGNLGFTKLLERLVRGVWPHTSILEYLHPSFWTKASFCASIIFVVDRKTQWISVYQNNNKIVYFAINLFFISYSCHHYLELAINEEEH